MKHKFSQLKSSQVKKKIYGIVEFKKDNDFLRVQILHPFFIWKQSTGTLKYFVLQYRAGAFQKKENQLWTLIMYWKSDKNKILIRLIVWIGENIMKFLQYLYLKGLDDFKNIYLLFFNFLCIRFFSEKKEYMVHI